MLEQEMVQFLLPYHCALYGFDEGLIKAFDFSIRLRPYRYNWFTVNTEHFLILSQLFTRKWWTVVCLYFTWYAVYRKFFCPVSE